MKFSFNMKQKKVDFDADVEKLVEKGMDNHEKDWQEKFDVKQSAKKNLLELKHKQKIELEETNKTKKNWLQKIQEEQRKTKELELAEQRRLKELELEEQRKLLELELAEKKRQEEKEHQNLVLKISISSILGLFGTGFFIAGTLGDSDLNFIGTILFVIIACIWLYTKKKK